MATTRPPERRRARLRLLSPPARRRRNRRSNTRSATSVRGRLAVVLSSARRRARARSWKFELDMDWVLARYAEQSGCCLLTGLSLEFLPPRDGKHLPPQPFTPSIDRIDWRCGYTRDNSRLVCTAANMALGAWGEKALERLARAYLARLREKARERRQRLAGAVSTGPRPPLRVKSAS